MTKLMDFLNAGVQDDMLLSVKARIKITNGSIFVAALNIIIYNLLFLLFAKPITFEMSWFRYICAIIILSTWWLNKRNHVIVGAHLLLAFSMLSVFHVAYYYLGPDYGYQKYFLIFALMPFLYFPKEFFVSRVLYATANLFLYFLLEQGHYDYFFKTNLTYHHESIATVFNLVNITIGFVTVISAMSIYEYIIRRDEEALMAALKSARYHAEYDYLTGAMNRRSMSEVLRNRLNDSALDHIPISIIMWDIDNFKAINDVHGHSIGDKVLETICNRIIKDYDDLQLARWGGEEFIILLDNCSLEHAVEKAESIRLLIESLDILDDKVTISLGVTTRRMDDSFSKMLLRVDALMYQAKNDGKNRISYE